MKRYLLTYEIIDPTGAFEIYPYINPSKIKSQEALDRSENYYEKFLAGDSSFKGMFLSYRTEIEVPAEPHAICDMHGWIETQPFGVFYPISAKFKNLLSEFNIPNVRFYEGSVKWKDIEYEYYVMHLLSQVHKYIDFKYSTFVKADYRGEKEPGTAVSGADMNEVYEKLETPLITFEKAVMHPEFRDIDMYHFNGILITERLKNAIESARLKGIEMGECPIDKLEFSDV